MRSRVRWRGDGQADVQAETGQGAQEIVKVCTLTGDCQYDASADGSIKAVGDQGDSNSHCPAPLTISLKQRKTVHGMVAVAPSLLLLPPSSSETSECRLSSNKRLPGLKHLNGI